MDNVDDNSADGRPVRFCVIGDDDQALQLKLPCESDQNLNNG